MAAMPRAKGGLLTANHSKRGCHFVTVFDPDFMQVSLLDPWEHAVLILCDGTLPVEGIAAHLRRGIEDLAVSVNDVQLAISRFREARLLEPEEAHQAADPLTAPTAPTAPTASPRTLAHLQQAYREWHKDPVKTGKILIGGSTPFVELDRGGVAAGLDPTVAFSEEVESEEEQTSVAVGTTLVLGDSREAFEDGRRSLISLLSEKRRGASGRAGQEPRARGRPDDGTSRTGTDGELQNVSELLRAVDHEFAWLEGVDGPPVHRVSESEVTQPMVPSPMPRGERVGAQPLLEDLGKTDRELAELPTAEAVLIEAPPTVRGRRISEAGLTPTMVGVPAEDGRSEPVFLAPPRAPDAETDPTDRLEVPNLHRAASPGASTPSHGSVPTREKWDGDV